MRTIAPAKYACEQVAGFVVHSDRGAGIGLLGGLTLSHIHESTNRGRVVGSAKPTYKSSSLV